MDNLTVILFLCATVPMIPALYIVSNKETKLFIGYMLLGNGHVPDRFGGQQLAAGIISR